LEKVLIVSPGQGVARVGFQEDFFLTIFFQPLLSTPLSPVLYFDIEKVLP